MKARPSLSRFSELALRQRRPGLTRLLPPFSQVLRGSLAERLVRCGDPAGRCARGERRGPVWYPTVTLSLGHTTGVVIGVKISVGGIQVGQAFSLREAFQASQWPG
jgi:hypothetical protein